MLRLNTKDPDYLVTRWFTQDFSRDVKVKFGWFVSTFKNSNTPEDSTELIVSCISHNIDEDQPDVMHIRSP
jgi:hypothetical protein